MAASLEDTDSIVRSLQFGIGVALHFLFGAAYLLVCAGGVEVGGEGARGGRGAGRDAESGVGRAAETDAQQKRPLNIRPGPPLPHPRKPPRAAGASTSSRASPRSAH